MKTELYYYLDNLGACDPALDWIDAYSINNPQFAWDTCPDARWLFWVTDTHLDKPGWPTRRELVLAACDCAETVLHLILAGEDRPRIAIETARRWAEGEATLEECRMTGLDAADAVAGAANAAYAADASYAAYYAAYAAYYAALGAAYHAAYTAYHAANSVANAIRRAGGGRKKALADLADLVRKRLYIGEVVL